MQILEEREIATEDELRLIQRLLSETKLQAKIGKARGEKLSAIVGTPHGDAPSPLLFLIYLEKVIRTADTEKLLEGQGLSRSCLLCAQHPSVVLSLL